MRISEGIQVREDSKRLTEMTVTGDDTEGTLIKIKNTVKNNEATTASRRTEGIEIKYNKQKERTKGKIEELYTEGIGKKEIKWHHATSILVFFVSLLYFIRHYFIVA